MKITTNNQARELLSSWQLPDGIMQNEFDYIDCPEDAMNRFFQYRGAWYDVREFSTIQARGAARYADHAVDTDSPLRQWHAIQTDTYFSGVVIRYADDDRVIVGRCYS